MSIKILTKNSIEITNIDGARNNNFNSAMRSGIVKGAFNEGNFFSASSNVIVLDTCELIISGHRVVIDSAESITLTNRPSTATRYSMVAEIMVSDISVPSFRLFIQPSSVDLIKQNLYTTNVGNGTYQLEIGKFTLQRDGTITDIVRTADLIVGGFSDKISAILNIGTITTNTLEPGMEAEVDVEQRLDEDSNKTLTDFTFSIPRGKGDPNTLTIGTITSGETPSATITGESPNQVLNLVLPRGEKGEKGDPGDIAELDTQMSATSENAVQNKVIYEYINSLFEQINGKELLNEEIDLSNGIERFSATTSTAYSESNYIDLSENQLNFEELFNSAKSIIAEIECDGIWQGSSTTPVLNSPTIVKFNFNTLNRGTDSTYGDYVRVSSTISLDENVFSFQAANNGSYLLPLRLTLELRFYSSNVVYNYVLASYSSISSSGAAGYNFWSLKLNSLRIFK